MLLFGNKIHANNTKAHLGSSFTPLIAKPKTTKHNNLSKCRIKTILPLQLKMYLSKMHTYSVQTNCIPIWKKPKSHLRHRLLLSIKFTVHLQIITVERSF